MAAHRIPESLFIDRLGEVRDYVAVVIEQAPPKVWERVRSVGPSVAAERPLSCAPQVHGLPFSVRVREQRHEDAPC